MLRIKKRNLEISIVFWFIIRLISELVSYFLIKKYGINSIIITHIADFLEGITLVLYYYEIKSKNKQVLWLLLIPPIYCLIELVFSGSIHDLKGISFSTYNALSSFLMLLLLFGHDKISDFSKPIVKALFIVHSVSFIYSTFEHLILKNIELMRIVYPFFLSTNLIFNFYLSYYLWSARKN